jgi:hypothetical protein
VSGYGCEAFIMMKMANGNGDKMNGKGKWKVTEGPWKVQVLLKPLIRANF